MLQDIVPEMQGPSSVIGYFGLSSDWRLEGWCWSAADPTRRQHVEVTLNGRVAHVCIAVQFNEILRRSGKGDGRCGFSLSPPAQLGVAGAGEIIVEARERASKTVLGRVIFHCEEAYLSQMKRLDVVEGQIRARNAALASSASPLLDGTGNALIRLGRGLYYGRGDRRWSDRDGSALRQARAALSRLAPIRLERHPNPELSLIFICADWQATYAAMRHAAAALVRVGKEFILLDDGSHPMTPLLTTVVDGLRVSRTPVPLSAASVNDAVRMANGARLCIVENPGIFVATAIEELMEHDHAIVAGSAAGAVSESRLNATVEIRRQPSVPPGVLFFMKRSGYQRAGGVEGSTDHGAIDWAGFVSKLLALGIVVVTGPACGNAQSSLASLAHSGLAE